MLLSTVVKNAGKLALSLVMGLALVGLLPIPAQAQDPAIDLELSGEGVTSWSIANIKPGDSGTRTVTLHNAGYRDGLVSIWISDIEEVDYGGDGAALDNYLLFSLSCSRLSPDLTLPATIHELPQNVSDSNYVKLTKLYADETLTIVWEWEFAETGEPQNDAQGDSLSFTINYLLEELPPEDDRGGGGGGDGRSSPEPELLQLGVDMWGKVTSGQRTRQGVLMETIEAISPDTALILLLPEGTRVLGNSGNPLDLIEVNPVTLPEPPPDKLVIGTGYDLQPSCTFYPPIKLILHYDSPALGDGIDEEELVIACYDRYQRGWMGMPTLIDAEADAATASLSHSSIFTLLVESPGVVEVPPFSAGIYNLSVNPSQVTMWGLLPFAVRTGQEVTVTADVVNSGYREGSYSVILKLNGHTRATQEVALGPIQSESVVFVLSDIQPGHYTVVLNGLSGEFTSSLWINWWLVGGIVAILAVISSLAAWWLVTRRKSKGV